MVTRRKLHTVKAASASIRIDKAEPNAALINFRLSSGDHLEIGMNATCLNEFLSKRREPSKQRRFCVQTGIRSLLGTSNCLGWLEAPNARRWSAPAAIATTELSTT